MIRVLVTEDEMPILRSTCTMIERTNPEFKVTHRAANGQEALEILESQNIELLILDIQMPIMDGVQVLKEMEKRNIHVPTIILSGFQDFSYVREALRCGAIDYILKPLKLEDLKSTLAKAENDIWKKKSSDNLSRNIEKEMFLYESEYNYEVALVISGAYRSSHEDDVSRYEEKMWGEYLNKFLNEHMPKESWWIIPGKYYNEHLIVFRKLGNRIQNILQDLMKDSSECLEMISPLTIVLSKKEQSHGSIYQANSELHQVAKEVMFLAEGQISTDDIEKIKKQNKERRDGAVKIITNLNRPEQIMPCIREALKHIQRRSVIIDVLKTGFWKYSELFRGNYSYVELEEELVRILESTYCKEVLYEKLEKLIVHDFYNEQFHMTNKSKLAIEMKEFIDINYMKSINNNTLSDHFGYVPAHLRELFRMQYEVSPMEYLQEIRLSKSKEMLRYQSQLSLKEISDLVGFNDSLYFSKVFRKANGMSPSEYRKKGEVNE